MLSEGKPKDSGHGETVSGEAESLPSGGSAGQERRRAADHEEGRAPARKGAETDREDEHD